MKKKWTIFEKNTAFHTCYCMTKTQWKTGRVYIKHNKQIKFYPLKTQTYTKLDCNPSYLILILFFSRINKELKHGSFLYKNLQELHVCTSTLTYTVTKKIFGTHSFTLLHPTRAKTIFLGPSGSYQNSNARNINNKFISWCNVLVLSTLHVHLHYTWKLVDCGFLLLIQCIS